MKSYRLFTFVLLILLSAQVMDRAAPARDKTTPGFVRLSLAGVHLSLKQGNYTQYDAAAGYYLDVSSYQDEIGLFLCPSLKRINEVGYARKIVRGTLPRLRTGSGVNLGDTPQQVARKLGATPGHYTYDRASNERVYIYRTLLPLRLVGGSSRKNWHYKASYTFHGEHLWSIQYEASESKSEEDN